MNILIIRFSSLGDLVTLEPTFRAIRKLFPKANITFLTTKIGQEFYKDSKYFDEFILYDGILKTIKKMPRKRFEILINLQCNKPSHYLSLFANKKNVVNKSYNLWQKIFKIKTHSKDIYELLISCDLDKKLVKEYLKNNPYIKLPAQENLELKEKFKNRKIVAISTGASQKWKSKRWGIENYENLILKIKDEFGVVLVGNESELEDEKYLLKKFGGDIISYIGKSDLGELKSILKTADLYIGNDSGPSHIAAGVGTPTITIFGSTGTKHCVKFEKYSSEHICLKPSKEISCHPCYKTICPTKHECMQNITVDRVYQAILEMGVAN